MNVDISVALISVFGVIVAAIITSVFSVIAAKKSAASSANKEDNKKIEATENGSSTRKQYNGSLVDFVEGVTKEIPLEIHIGIEAGGRIIIFLTHTLKVHLRLIEFHLDERRLVFVSDANQMRDFGISVSKEVSEHIREQDKALLVRIDKKSDESFEIGYVKLKIFK